MNKTPKSEVEKLKELNLANAQSATKATLMVDELRNQIADLNKTLFDTENHLKTETIMRGELEKKLCQACKEAFERAVETVRTVRDRHSVYADRNTITTEIIK